MFKNLQFQVVIVILLGVIALFSGGVLSSSRMTLIDPESSFFLDFDNFKNYFSSLEKRYYPLDQGLVNVSIRKHRKSSVLLLKGKGEIFSRKFFPIDVTKSYKLSVVIRIISEDRIDHEVLTQIGIVTFDKSGEVEPLTSGRYRLGLISKKLTAQAHWRKYSVIFQGAEVNSTSFSPTTGFAKLVFLFNQSGNGKFRTEVRSFSFYPVQNQ